MNDRRGAGGPLDFAQGLLRGAAVMIGLFTIVNLLGGWVAPGFDANVWWIDTRPLPQSLSFALLGTGGVLLILHGLWPASRGARARATRIVTLALAGIALWNAVGFYGLLLSGALHGGPALPLSLPLAAVLATIASVSLRRRGLAQRMGMTAAVPACVLLGALSLMWTFGKADYRRPADAIVVFGARAYADGRPSDALADRVNTAIALYHEGWAPRLIVSGGPGDAAFHETDVMRQMVIDAGVPDAAILVDRQGLSTSHTVTNTAALRRQHGIDQVLAVSHGYHLPRVKLAFERAGIATYTVPAHERYMLTKMPVLMMREVAAWWWYYARPLA